MKPQIILIRAHGRDDGFRAIPWGIVDIASYLKKYGYKAIVIDRKEFRYPLRRIIKEVLDRDIRYVGISAMTSQAEDAEFLCKHLKKNKKNIILGGLHYTICPEEGLKIGDYVFKGESELSLLDFLENGPKTRVYESRPLLNLDDIPLPNVDLLRGLYIYRTPFTIMTARGCNYNCTFCLDKKYRPGTVRYHSYAYVCDLLEILIKSFNLGNFLIGDDIFTINKGRVIEICREVRKRSLKVNLSAFTHVGIDDLELYKEMRGAGFTGLIIGIESASDEVLRAMNKQQTVAEIRKTIDIIKEAGLNVSVLFMVGNILETEKSLNASLELANELRSRGCAGWVSYAQPFPGTKFYELCPKYGKLINKNPKEYWNDRMVFIPDGISRSKLKFYRTKIAIALMAHLPWTTRAMYKLF